MKTLTERMNFADAGLESSPSRSFQILKWRNPMLSAFDNLCLYCSDNDVCLDSVSDDDFQACADLIGEYGQEDKSTSTFVFWIDEE